MTNNTTRKCYRWYNFLPLAVKHLGQSEGCRNARGSYPYIRISKIPARTDTASKAKNKRPWVIYFNGGLLHKSFWTEKVGFWVDLWILGHRECVSNNSGSFRDVIPTIRIVLGSSMRDT